MKETPIIFTENIDKIQNGTKTMTRRVIHKSISDDIRENDINYNLYRCPYGQSGDRLWVRESFNWSSDEELIPGENHKKCPERTGYSAMNVVWAADGFKEHPKYGKALWLPSIHMPRWASRILLEVVSVRIERIQDISNKDAIREGIDDITVFPGDSSQINFASWHDKKNGMYWNYPTAREAFHGLWDSINKKRGYGWDVNPYVWAIEFKIIEGAK